MVRSYERNALVAVAGLAMAGLAFAQQYPTTPAQSQTPSSSTAAPTQMPAMTPSKSETAAAAFEKLDATKAGFVSKEQVAKLDGFDKAFTQADKNKDGRLDSDEFKAAWAIYTGKP